MKKKKVLILSLLLVGILAIGSSLALLSDTDSDYNTMTTGFARIDQLEYERDENGDLIPFVQDQLLIPTTGTPSWADEYQKWEEVGAEGSNQLFADSFANVKDKFVFVKNTGLVNVYYRTIIAVEAPEGTDINGYPAIMPNVNGNERFDWDFVQLDGETGEEAGLYISVDGVRYYVMVANYLHELTPGEVSRPSLLQVYMRKEVTNEMIAKFGPEVDILVFSQAVQSKGYSDAKTALEEGFGKISADNHPWSTATFNRITTLSGEVNLTEDLWLVDEPFYNETVTGPLTINGNGHVVNQTITDSELMSWTGGTIPDMGTMFASENGELVTVNDLTFQGTNMTISLGKYKNATYANYNTVLNNVNVIDLEIAAHLSMDFSPAVIAYGNATLNNSNVYGTRQSLRDLLDGPVYDMAIVNYSTATLNNSRVDTIYMWKQGNLVVNEGSTVDTLYLLHTDKNGVETNPDHITVNEGGLIKNVVTKNGTFTYEEWVASRSEA